MSATKPMPPRRPKKPSPEVRLPFEAMHLAAAAFVPEVDRWWFSMHSALVSVMTVEEFRAATPKAFADFAGKVDGPCSIAKRSAPGETCGRETDFVVLTVFVDPATRLPANVRLRRVCAGCLYVNMSKTIATLTDVDFYEGHEDEGGNSDPDVLYLVGERMSMFQDNLVRAVEVLKERHPDLYAVLTAKIQSGETSPDW